MNPHTWATMVKESRRLEKALGDGVKKVEKNEQFTSFIQRRAYYASQDIEKGEKIKSYKIIPLRPYLKNSFSPDQDKLIIGKKTLKQIKKGECIKKYIVR